MSLSKWPAVAENVIVDDICTDAQLRLLEMRARRGPLSKKAIEKRHASINPRFFQEVRPILEKDASLADMHARWARDKATAVQEHEKAAEYGAQFVSWPVKNERRWPKPSRAWLQHGRWFAMWRCSRRAMQAEARKLKMMKAKSLSKKAGSCSDSDASWEELSVCSDSSWQAASEVSDASWLELATEDDILAQMDMKVAEASGLKQECQKDLENAMPALHAAVAALNCLSKGDVVEFKAMAKPPAGAVLVAKALCYCFSLGPKKEDDQKFDFWAACKKNLIGDASFLSRLQSYDKDNMSDYTLSRLLPFEADPAFQPESIGKASLAAKGLCMWVHAIIVYARVAKEIAPKRDALRRVEMELEIAKAALGNRNQFKAPEETAEEIEAPEEPCTDDDMGLALEEAVEALKVLDRKDIGEIKNFSRPPQPVMIVCMCVVTLRPLGKEQAWQESAGWAGAKAMLSDTRLLQAMQQYNKDNLQEKQISRVRKLLNKERAVFEGERMKSVSKAGYGLLQWVRAMVKYYDVAKSVEAKRKQVKECADNSDSLGEAEMKEWNLSSPTSTTEPSPLSSPVSSSPLPSNGEHEPEASSPSLFPTVDLKCIRELKALSKPPAGIDVLFSAVIELQAGINPRIELDEACTVKDCSWKAVQKMLGDPKEFIHDLKVIEGMVEAGMVPQGNIEMVWKIQREMGEDFLPEAIKKKSAAAEGLSRWLAAVLAQFDPPAAQTLVFV